MENRGLKVLALLLALAIALTVGALLGGGIVYGLSRIESVVPSAQAQTADPGYGVVIAAVETGGPADAAGVVRGDILLEIDGQALENGQDLMRILGEQRPGAEVELAVLHGDEERRFAATLGDREDRAYLGIVPCGALELDEIEREIELTIEGSGAVIAEVISGGPAEAAGVREGDVVLAVDGQELNADKNLADVIAEYEPGDIVALEIERPGEEGPLELSVALGEHPEKGGSAYLGVRYHSLPHVEMLRGLPEGSFREFDFDDLPFELPEGEFDIPFDLPQGELQQGALVRSVDEGSPAADAGLAVGDVITGIDGEAVESPEALSKAIATLEPGQTILLNVFRPEAEIEMEMEIVLAKHPDEAGKAYLGVTVGGFYRLQRFRGGEGPLPPGEFEFPFHFELPFEHEFEFHWPPGRNECPGGPGCSDDSV
jgi:S1-C subfamily serine protease